MDQPRDGDQVILEYTRADDPFGQSRPVRLTEYTRAAWDTLPAGAHGPFDHCTTSEEVARSAGSATIYSSFSWPDDIPPGPDDPCPADRPPDRFFAHVFLDRTTVVVELSDWPGQRHAGIEDIVRALEPRAP